MSYRSPDILTLLRRYWPFLPVFTPPGGQQEEFEGQLMAKDATLGYRTAAGRPVRTEVSIAAGSYDVYTGGTRVTRSYGALRLPEALVDINAEKRIVATEVAGRDGSVLEYINREDYMGTIRSVFVSADLRYPQAEVEALKRILDSNQPLTVGGRWMELHGISRIVITGEAWPAPGPMVNAQPFELRWRATQPVELLAQEERAALATNQNNPLV